MRKWIAILMLAPLLSGCWLTSAYLWAPYRSPSAGDFRTVSGLPGCPRIGAQNLRDPRDWAAVSGAVAEVCRIYRSERFAVELSNMRLRATCDRPGGSEDWIASDDVLPLLTGSMEDLSVMVRKPLFAIAQIDPQRARIAVRRQWIDDWHDTDRSKRANLIGTMGHEMSHFVREQGQDYFRFRDGGHTREAPGCPDAELVSYAVGNMVKRHWLEEQGLSADPR